MTNDFKISAEAPTATGTTTISSSAYDMTGFDAITFIVRIGTPAANNSIKVNQAATSGGSYNDLAGTNVGGATNNIKVVTVHRPGKQFIKCSVVRGTTTTIDALTVIQWRAKGVHPITQNTAVDFEEWFSPAEGTA